MLCIKKTVFFVKTVGKKNPNRKRTKKLQQFTPARVEERAKRSQSFEVFYTPSQNNTVEQKTSERSCYTATW